MFKKTDVVDVWAQLYKLITRLSQILPGEPDTNFIGKFLFSFIYQETKTQKKGKNFICCER